MNPDPFSFIWDQLPYRLPGLIVYFAGLCVSLSYLGRFPKPAVLALLATVLLLGASIGGMVIFYLQVRQPGEAEWLRLTSIGISCMNACAIALLLWATFADRQQFYPPEFFETGGRDDAMRRE
jgi:hypothetical protein